MKNYPVRADIWEQTDGDVNANEYGGTFMRYSAENEIEWFDIQVSAEGNKFAFHGTFYVPDLKDYDDAFVEMAKYGIEPENSIFSKVSALLHNYGVGIFEFSPRNKDGVGEYSLQYTDFEVTDEELKDFMKEVGII